MNSETGSLESMDRITESPPLSADGGKSDSELETTKQRGKNLEQLKEELKNIAKKQKKRKYRVFSLTEQDKRTKEEKEELKQKSNELKVLKKDTTKTVQKLYNEQFKRVKETLKETQPKRKIKLHEALKKGLCEGQEPTEKRQQHKYPWDDERVPMDTPLNTIKSWKPFRELNEKLRQMTTMDEQSLPANPTFTVTTKIPVEENVKVYGKPRYETMITDDQGNMMPSAPPMYEEENDEEVRMLREQIQIQQAKNESQKEQFMSQMQKRELQILQEMEDLRQMEDNRMKAMERDRENLQKAMLEQISQMEEQNRQQRQKYEERLEEAQREANEIRQDVTHRSAGLTTEFNRQMREQWQKHQEELDERDVERRQLRQEIDRLRLANEMGQQAEEGMQMSDAPTTSRSSIIRPAIIPAPPGYPAL